MTEMKSRIELFASYDHTGMKRHLEKMAAKGWKLTGRSGIFWRYEKVEPQKLHYMVIYSENIYTDMGDWNLVIKDEKLNVFCSDKDCPEPIAVNAAEQLELIHSDMKTRSLLVNCLLVMTALVQIYIHADDFKEMAVEEICWSALCVVLGVLALINLIGYLLWLRKAKVSVVSMNLLPESKTPVLGKKIVYALFGLLLLGGMGVSLTDSDGGELIIGAIFLVATVISVLITIKVNKHVKSRVAQTVIIGLTWIISIIVVIAICMFIMMHVLVIKDVYF